MDDDNDGSDGLHWRVRIHRDGGVSIFNGGEACRRRNDHQGAAFQQGDVLDVSRGAHMTRGWSELNGGSDGSGDSIGSDTSGKGSRSGQPGEGGGRNSPKWQGSWWDILNTDMNNSRRRRERKLLRNVSSRPNSLTHAWDLDEVSTQTEPMGKKRDGFLSSTSVRLAEKEERHRQIMQNASELTGSGFLNRSTSTVTLKLISLTEDAAIDTTRMVSTSSVASTSPLKISPLPSPLHLTSTSTTILPQQQPRSQQSEPFEQLKTPTLPSPLPLPPSSTSALPQQQPRSQQSEPFEQLKTPPLPSPLPLPPSSTSALPQQQPRSQQSDPFEQLETPPLPSPLPPPPSPTSALPQQQPRSQQGELLEQLKHEQHERHNNRGLTVSPKRVVSSKLPVFSKMKPHSRGTVLSPKANIRFLENADVDSHASSDSQSVSHSSSHSSKSSLLSTGSTSLLSSHASSTPSHRSRMVTGSRIGTCHDRYRARGSKVAAALADARSSLHRQSTIDSLGWSDQRKHAELVYSREHLIEELGSEQTSLLGETQRLEAALAAFGLKPGAKSAAAIAMGVANRSIHLVRRQDVVGYKREVFLELANLDPVDKVACREASRDYAGVLLEEEVLLSLQNDALREAARELKARLRKHAVALATMYTEL